MMERTLTAMSVISFFYFLFFSDGRGGKKFGGDLRIEKDEVKKTEKEGAKDEK